MILVTGAAGYIGSHFVRQILREWPDVQVLAVDDLSTGHRASLPAHERLVFAQVNIGDEKAIAGLLETGDVDAVVHFSASTLVGESELDPGKYFSNIVSNSISFFKVLEKYKVRKIIHSSSCAVYGIPQTKYLSEEHPLAPLNSYGLSKLMVEEVLRTYERCHGWSHFSLRYFNAAGAEPDGSYGENHNPETHLIPLVLQVASGRRDKIVIFGNDFDTPDGTCIRDYIHVTDLCSAHLLALKKLLLGEPGVALNLGTGVGCSVKELIELSEKIVGKKIKQEPGPRRLGDPDCLVAKNDKAQHYLNWKPELSLESMLNSAWLWELNRSY